MPETQQPPVAQIGMIDSLLGTEGSSFSFTSSSYDPDGDPLQYRWDFDNDGVFDTSWSSDPTASWIPDDSNPYLVLLEVTDGVYVSADQALVKPANKEPFVDAGQHQTGTEGIPVTATASFSDMGVGDTHTAVVDWDDGSPEDVVAVTETLGAGTLSASHTYADDGVYDVWVKVTDDDGGEGEDFFVATVLNANPSAVMDLPGQTDSGFILPFVDEVSFNASFADTGWLDTHTVAWNFGDGTTAAGTMFETNSPPAATGTASVGHAFSAPGTYLVSFTVTDDDGGSASASRTVQVTSADEAMAVVGAYISSLPDGAFSKHPDQWRSVLAIKLDEVLSKIADGDYAEAAAS